MKPRKRLSWHAFCEAVEEAVRSLPEPFHKDPCDRIIVATARRLDMPPATTDGLIRRYAPNVKLVTS